MVKSMVLGAWAMFTALLGISACNSYYRQSYLENKLEIEIDRTREANEIAQNAVLLAQAQEEELQFLQNAVDRRVLRQLKIQEVRTIIKQAVIALPRESYYDNSKSLSATQITKIAEYIVDYSEQYDVPLSLSLALIRQESAFNINAISRVNAKGLTQLMPSTAAMVARQLGKIEYDINNPQTQIQFGLFYFSTLLDLYRDSPEKYRLAVNAYNAGPGVIYRKELPRETIEHETYIFKYASEFRQQGL